ncbi:unnamed protein product, partial [marine sediment metagenome]
GEIVLVVIGILIALQINAWNEGRVNQKKANAYLSMLSNEIENNLRRLDMATDFAQQHQDYNLNTLKELNSDSANFIDIDNLYKLTTAHGPHPKTALERSVFDDLINSGAMENVTDSLLRNEIFRIESFLKRYDLEHHNIQLIWEEQVRPYHLEHLNESRIIGMLESKFDTDVSAFVHNRKYANIMAGNIIFLGDYKKSIEDINKEFKLTLMDIRSYLSKESTYK